MPEPPRSGEVVVRIHDGGPITRDNVVRAIVVGSGELDGRKIVSLRDPRRVSISIRIGRFLRTKITTEGGGDSLDRVTSLTMRLVVVGTGSMIVLLATLGLLQALH